VVEDCFTDRSAHYAADGSVISAGNPAPHHAEVIMVNEDGTWKRSEFNLGDPCEP
jgi:hypothetical protein